MANQETINKNGKVYWATPTVKVLVNGVTQISPFSTFEWCCEDMESADVVEQEVFPQYIVGENGEEDYVSYSSPLVVVKKERLLKEEGEG